MAALQSVRCERLRAEHRPSGDLEIIKSRSQTHVLKTRNRQDNRDAGERGDRNESPDADAVHRENLRLTKLEQQGQVSNCDHLSFA
ncbi:MAG: hypothetical protein ACJ8E2_03215 [Bradyrhizobium sp.]